MTLMVTRVLRSALKSSNSAASSNTPAKPLLTPNPKPYLSPTPISSPPYLKFNPPPSAKASPPSQTQHGQTSAP
ncbi:hypothetical protein EMPG_17420 [Blastomyces silverae]|uniref:Uncharacterized protein n=1 Tax=Blastomyces silverae TaxID=2060906 RepID=A0A0H1B7W9_9EURO|nr:hypothetical protein EMPG_17420 [Blastomyces silverae]